MPITVPPSAKSSLFSGFLETGAIVSPDAVFDDALKALSVQDFWAILSCLAEAGFHTSNGLEPTESCLSIETANFGDDRVVLLLSLIDAQLVYAASDREARLSLLLTTFVAICHAHATE